MPPPRAPKTGKRLWINIRIDAFQLERDGSAACKSTGETSRESRDILTIDAMWAELGV